MSLSQSIRSRDAAYRHWQACDAVWQGELVKAFGRDAGNRRYDYDNSGHPARCRAARDAFHAAQDQYRIEQSLYELEKAISL